MKEKYQPTQEEVNKAELMMADKQKEQKQSRERERALEAAKKIYEKCRDLINEYNNLVSKGIIGPDDSYIEDFDRYGKRRDPVRGRWEILHEIFKKKEILKFYYHDLGYDFKIGSELVNQGKNIKFGEDGTKVFVTGAHDTWDKYLYVHLLMDPNHPDAYPKGGGRFPEDTHILKEKGFVSSHHQRVSDIGKLDYIDESSDSFRKAAEIE